MEFRDLKQQYAHMNGEINEAVLKVMAEGGFISGWEVRDLEKKLAEYVGAKYCVTCANGTDALLLALKVWEIGPGDAVFVPDFTFFSTGEAVAAVGAVPVFVDVERDTFNLSPEALEKSIEIVLAKGKLRPRAVIPVDLFGHPADYGAIKRIVEQYGLLILEDGAQGFGGMFKGKRSCSFGHISTTSFFPAKPLGCYGDGGAIFTDREDWNNLLRSLCIHGKGEDKYDNVRIGMNSRLDTMQAAILAVKLRAFTDYELDAVNLAAEEYGRRLKGIVCIPLVKKECVSSWAQYTIILDSEKERDGLCLYLKEKEIPSFVYYRKEMHAQKAFQDKCVITDCPNSSYLVKRVLSLPIHPYMKQHEIEQVCHYIGEYKSGQR